MIATKNIFSFKFASFDYSFGASSMNCRQMIIIIENAIGQCLEFHTNTL